MAAAPRGGWPRRGVLGATAQHIRELKLALRRLLLHQKLALQQPLARRAEWMAQIARRNRVAHIVLQWNARDLDCDRGRPAAANGAAPTRGDRQRRPGGVLLRKPWRRARGELAILLPGAKPGTCCRGLPCVPSLYAGGPRPASPWAPAAAAGHQCRVPLRIDEGQGVLRWWRHEFSRYRAMQRCSVVCSIIEGVYSGGDLLPTYGLRLRCTRGPTCDPLLWLLLRLRLPY